MKNSLNYFIEKIKGAEKDIYLVLLVILVGLLGFGLGRLSRLEENRAPILIKNKELSMPNKVVGLHQELGSPDEGGRYVASRTGNSYYLPWCSGVKKIKEGNKVWFNSEEEALAAGYRAAANCKGI